MLLVLGKLLDYQNIAEILYRVLFFPLIVTRSIQEVSGFVKETFWIVASSKTMVGLK
jgi:hypothetical protein